MPKKVLVVDDSILLHRMYELALKSYARAEIAPVLASDGREAFVRLQEHPDVVLILLDVNMPAMSGLEFLERLRAEPAFRDVRVVLQSTEDQIQDVRRGLAAGAVGYLTKPFTPRQLHQLLDVVLV
ncbi:MAG TPA: response regulator [Gemmatimonadales bacterium]|nr:response regulator [Gemmatimonadales bacterium]